MDVRLAGLSAKSVSTSLLTLVALTSAMSAQARNVERDILQRMMMGGPMMDEADLKVALAKAEGFPLGSHENPVRAAMPTGQRAYLARLRCGDGTAPAFVRIGNVGPGVYRSIVDDYLVDCGAAAPGKVHIMMDMYFSGYVESRPVPGFALEPDDVPPTGGPSPDKA